MMLDPIHEMGTLNLPMAHSYDPIAAKILFKTFWTSQGWKRNEERTISPDDFAYAKSKGVMFDPVDLHHDQVVRELMDLVSSVSVERITDGFLASLGNRNLPFRSALLSYAIASGMPHHAYTAPSSGSACSICGEYLSSIKEDHNVLNFERLKWGGVRHFYPAYQLFDLREFLKLSSASSSKQDKLILRAILQEIKLAPPQAKPGDLAKSIGKYISSSQYERQILLVILACCGILKLGYLGGLFEEMNGRIGLKLPQVGTIGWSYPSWWYKGTGRINQEALDYYFPLLV